MNALNFLISTSADFYITIIILRIWLQAARTDYYHPLSQAVIKATNFAVVPMRKVLPTIGSIDLATVVFAYIISVLKFVLLAVLSSRGSFIFDINFLLIGALSLLKDVGSLLFWLMLIRAILSWVSQGMSPAEQILYQLTEPMLEPIRRIIPVIGGFDLSVLVLFVSLQFINYLMGDIVGPLWYQL